MRNLSSSSSPPPSSAPTTTFTWAVCWLLAAVTVCFAIHGGMSAMLWHLQPVVAVLFGVQSLVCVAVICCLVLLGTRERTESKQMLNHRSSSMNGLLFRDRSRSFSAARGKYCEPSTPSRLLAFLGEETTPVPNPPSTARFDGMDGVKLLKQHVWLAWALVLTVAGADLLWALCGIRSFWFAIAPPALPTQCRAAMLLLMGNLVACTALLSGAELVSLRHQGPLPGPWRTAVLDLGSCVLPGVLSLVQLLVMRSPNGPATKLLTIASAMREEREEGAPPDPTNALDRTRSNSLFNPRFRLRRTKTLRYSVSKMIASGAFSEVFLGLSHDTGELICVKQLAAGLQESYIDMMESEVQLMRSLGHPNIVQYLGTDRQKRFTILLEYVPGGSIAKLLSQFGRLQEEVIKGYIEQVVPSCIVPPARPCVCCCQSTADSSAGDCRTFGKAQPRYRPVYCRPGLSLRTHASLLLFLFSKCGLFLRTGLWRILANRRWRSANGRHLTATDCDSWTKLSVDHEAVYASISSSDDSRRQQRISTPRGRLKRSAKVPPKQRMTEEPSRTGTDLPPPNTHLRGLHQHFWDLVLRVPPNPRQPNHISHKKRAGQRHRCPLPPLRPGMFRQMLVGCVA